MWGEVSLAGPLVSEGGAVWGRAALQSSKENKASGPGGKPGREGPPAPRVPGHGLGPWRGGAHPARESPLCEGRPGRLCWDQTCRRLHSAGLWGITAASRTIAGCGHLLVDF